MLTTSPQTLYNLDPFLWLLFLTAKYERYYCELLRDSLHFSVHRYLGQDNLNNIL